MFYDCRSLTSLDLSNFTFEIRPFVTTMLSGVGANVIDKPIPVKVTADGYTYLTERDCDIDAANAKFVKSDGTAWSVTE